VNRMHEIEVARNPDALSTIKLNRTIAPILNGDDRDLILRDRATGEVVACQVSMPELTTEARLLARLLRFTKQPWSDPNGTLTKTERLSGIGSNNLMIGHTAPNAMYKRYASKIAPVHIENPATGELFSIIAQPIWQKFVEVLPQEASHHLELTRNAIHEDWWINKTPFSSGVCNDKAVLPYHKDQGNVVNAWSMMFCIRNKMNGGHLHLPEYDATLAIADLSVLFFCGQRTIHGVTPLLPKAKEAYRFSTVYYTKSLMAKCGPAKEEVLRAQIASTARIVQ